MAKRKNKSIIIAQYLMIFVGLFMIILSYLIFSTTNINSFIQSLQPEFGSVGIALVLIGGVWRLTNIKINT